MSPLKSGDNALERAVTAFLREQLETRYALENMRRYRAFDGLPDGKVHALRDFCLRHVYPEWETRCFQDKAFEKLLALLDTPLRLAPLTAVAMKSLFRFGRDLPRAVDAGKQVMAAFEAMRGLESSLVERVREHAPARGECPVSSEAVRQAMAAMGRHEFEGFVQNTTALMELLAQRSLLATGTSVLADIARAMEKRPDLYDELERKGMLYAASVMEEGMALFDTLDPAEVAGAIRGIPEVEGDWFNSVTRTAAP